MTEGKIWCDLCKILISNNSSSFKNHDLSQCHKDNVTKSLSDKRKEKVVRYKEKKESACKKSLSHQNDISTFEKDKDCSATSLGAQTSNEETCDLSTMLGHFGDWERDLSLGYYYNQSNRCYYDPNSGLYYTHALGKWVTLKQILAASLKLSSIQKKPNSATSSSTSKSQNDISTFHQDTYSNATSLGAQTSTQGIDEHSSMFGDWEHDMSSGYYYNVCNSCFFDPTSGFYYTHALGKWATLKEAVADVPNLSSASRPPIQKFTTSTFDFQKSNPNTICSNEQNQGKRKPSD